MAGVAERLNCTRLNFLSKSMEQAFTAYSAQL